MYLLDDCSDPRLWLSASRGIFLERIKSKGGVYKEVTNENTAVRFQTFLKTELRMADTDTIEIPKARRMGRASNGFSRMITAKVCMLIKTRNAYSPMPRHYTILDTPSTNGSNMKLRRDVYLDDQCTRRYEKRRNLFNLMVIAYLLMARLSLPWILHLYLHPVSLSVVQWIRRWRRYPVTNKESRVMCFGPKRPLPAIFKTFRMVPTPPQLMDWLRRLLSLLTPSASMDEYNNLGENFDSDADDSVGLSSTVQ